jgi:hypothetical protein
MSLSREETVAFVDRLYAVCAAGNWDAVADMLTDDFVAHEADGLPMAGEYRGRGGLKELYAKVMGMVDVVALDRAALPVGEDCAIAVLTMRFADPALKPAELCEMMRFRDGKCCEIKPYYFEPAPFLAACEAKKVAA